MEANLEVKADIIHNVKMFLDSDENDEQVLLVSSDGDYIQQPIKILSVYSGHMREILSIGSEAKKDSVFSVPFSKDVICSLFQVLVSGTFSMATKEDCQSVVELAELFGINISNFTIEDRKENEKPKKTKQQRTKKTQKHDVDSSVKNDGEVLSEVSEDDMFVRESTDEGKASFMCKKCEKTFPSKPQLKMHFLTHTGQ